MSDALSTAKARAAATYDAAADHFDDHALGFWSRFGQRTVERLALRPGARVLDVCCGSGASAIPAATAVGPTGAVLAVDLAKNLLALGRAKAARHGLANVEFRFGDMTALGLPDDHFDAVVIVFGIFFVPNMETQVRELWRMVRPGGALAVTTWGAATLEPMYTVWGEELLRERPDLHTAFNPWDRITEPDAVRALLRAAGCTGVDAVAEAGSQPLATPEDWWNIVLGSGLRWSVEQMGPAAAARVRKVGLERARGVGSVTTNVIYGTAVKERGSSAER